MEDFRVSILGSRGTCALEGESYSKFGGATSCIYVCVAGLTIVLDGGSGIMSLPKYLGNSKNIHLFLSHPHVDHIIGITTCPIFFDPEITINIYAKKHCGKTVEEQLNSLMQPPLWPVNTGSFTANVCFHTCEDNFSIGDINIKTLNCNHPGGSTAFRIDYSQKSLVYATDCELTDKNFSMVEDFARNCSFLLFDGQYTQEELAQKKGFGHSSYIQAAEIAKSCNAGQLGIIHHDPSRTDNQLYEMQETLKGIFKNGFFTRMGEEKTL